jgi:hypothetical protein
MTHALVVGGTGMLGNVSRYLTGTFQTVSVIARHPERLGATELISPLALDYRNDHDLVSALRQSIDQNGPISLAVCWIHSTAPNALANVVNEIAASGQPFRLLVISGSGAADPARVPNVRPSTLPPQCLYRHVILGWMGDGTRSRWLTHVEISHGVVQAIESDAAESIVGAVRPWHLRPI